MQKSFKNNRKTVYRKVDTFCLVIFIVGELDFEKYQRCVDTHTMEFLSLLERENL